MSNKVSLQVCEFVDYYEDRSICYHHYGYRIYDDYDSSYNNTFDTLGQVFDEIGNPLHYVEDYHSDFFESVVHAGGMYFCNDWISLLGPEEEEEEDE
jgi:hypothetical protein